MKRFIFLLAALFMLLTIYSQTTINLTFTANDGADYTQLDSIKVMNRTQGGDTVLFYPDTVLSLVMTGINEFISKENGFHLFQNYPNPVNDQSTVSLQIPTSFKLNITITDILGRTVIKSDHELEKGTHSFRFTPGDGDIYFFTARYKNESRSIKMLCSPIRSGKHISINYLGNIDENTDLKASSHVQSFLFNYGDELLYIGYYDTLQSGILDIPEESNTYIFQFAYNIPCPGTPSLTDADNNIYNTVQIGNHCWMKENLKTTKYRNGTSIPNVIVDSIWSNLTTGAYRWYDNDISWKDLYGAHYNWYATDDTSSLCPLGWHIPTYDELTELTYFVGGTDSPYGNKLKSCLQVNSPLGGNCNTTNHPRWDEDNSDWGTDVYGFSGLPGGLQDIQEDRSISIGGWGLWWSSEIDPYNSITLNLHYSNGGVGISSFGKEYGMSVRCIKDSDPSNDFTKLSFSAVDYNDNVQLDSIKVMNRTHEGEKVLVYPDTTLTLEFDLPNYHTGDLLLLIGYYDTLESGILHTPVNDTSYTFQFAYNIPCPGNPTVEYEGQTYNTVQIMSQCWLKENLNVGTMIQGSEDMTDNDTIEKYCYENAQDSCAKYGGLYQWDEMMQYTTQQGVQGICPPGWHIPTDEEWKVLEGAADSQFGIGDNTWDEIGVNGLDAGTNMKTTNGWYEDGNGADLFGFSGLPGGHYDIDNDFIEVGLIGIWWTSSESYEIHKWSRYLHYFYSGVDRENNPKNYGFSVRCIKD